MTADFSSKTMDVRRKWHNIFHLTEKTLNPVEILFMNEGEISAFSEMEENYRCVTGRPTFRMA